MSTADPQNRPDLPMWQTSLPNWLMSQLTSVTQPLLIHIPRRADCSVSQAAKGQRHTEGPDLVFSEALDQTAFTGHYGG